MTCKILKVADCGCLPLLNVYSEDSEGDSCCLMSCTKEFIAYKPLLDCLSFMHLVVPYMKREMSSCSAKN